ncbi:hypothetical protein FEE96_03630 [Parasedimentitalea maritima]|uniref:Peptidoglycan binding-like domain-containing protein n=1 Tax=Parasedimentitalea maritima TaxID=2578117 RepID=A0ABY2V0Z6_9RHOB|nr:hypothetical protein [Zongyanglinia marina]TLP69382.1 hypothetical protein FEE96_03630 [Zongyanglinia marina]
MKEFLAFICSKKILSAAALSLSWTLGADAADIELLAVNPVFGPDYTLLDLGDNNAVNPAWAGSYEFRYARQTPAVDSAYQRPSGEGWNEEDGMYLGEGGGSYEMMHLQMAWPTLQNSRVIKISGSINPGDTERLKALVQATGFSVCSRENQCPSNNTISLNSPGGHLAEAIKMGVYISEQNFSTLIEKDAICESACSLTFLGGFTNYEGFFFPRRYVHETAKFGVHRPYFELQDGSYSDDVVKQIVGVVNETVTAATTFLLKVGVGANFLQRMYNTPPEQMYRLSPLELSTQRIFVLGRDQRISNLTRRQIFAHCATIYLSEYSKMNPILLANLQTDGSSFITFIPGNNFICAGAKSVASNTWYSHICVEGDCGISSGLAQFGQVEMSYTDIPDNSPVWDVAVAVDVLGPGAGFREFRHRSVLLKYVRAYADSNNFRTLREMPAAALQTTMPQAYCGEIDGFDPGLVLNVQDLLNRNGLNVGRPDGAAGPNTRRGIRAFNKTALGEDSEKVDVEFLAALGASAESFAGFQLCP